MILCSTHTTLPHIKINITSSSSTSTGQANHPEILVIEVAEAADRHTQGQRHHACTTHSTT